MNLEGTPFNPVMQGEQHKQRLEGERESQAKESGQSGRNGWGGSVALEIRSSEDEAGDSARWDPKSFKKALGVS